MVEIKTKLIMLSLMAISGEFENLKDIKKRGFHKIRAKGEN